MSQLKSSWGKVWASSDGHADSPGILVKLQAGISCTFFTRIAMVNLNADRVALFLDVENLSGWLKSGGGQKLLAEANQLGQVVVRRAYGNFSQTAVSARQPELNTLGFELVHVYHPVKGKNSADIQIVVDVMDTLRQMPDLQWFVLATGDSDFSPLFRRLRELGKSIVGVGPRSVLSESVNSSCEQFIYIQPELEPASEPEIAPTAKPLLELVPASAQAQQAQTKQTQTKQTQTSPTSQQAQNNKLRKQALAALKKVLAKSPDAITLPTLKLEIQALNPGFDIKQLGHSKFLKFLESASEIVVLQKNGSHWMAKPVSTAKKAKSAAA